MTNPDPKPVCPHSSEVRDIRECWQCMDVALTQLAIARSYLRELAQADFNEHGDCTHPIAEPLQGRHFSQIANTALKHIS